MILNHNDGVDNFYAIVCVNTTGGNLIQGDRIIETAVIVLDSNYDIVEKQSTLVNPGRKIVPSPYHDITNSMVENAPTFEEINTELLTLLHNKVLVVYPYHSTVPFLNNQIVGKQVAENNVLNVQNYVTFLYPELRNNHTFTDVLKFFNIPHGDTRPALNKAEALHKLVTTVDPVDTTNVAYFNPDSVGYQPFFAFWTPYTPPLNS